MNIIPECALYQSLHIISVRMEAGCENPLVRLGSKTCEHFTGQSQEEYREPQDITGSCRRARACREALPVETYFPEADL
jgi:hypothetical protein